MTTQINPPFDGSAPCAGCNSTVREVAAYLHNFLKRCDVPGKRILQAKALQRIWDLRAIDIPSDVPYPHPAVGKLLQVARAMRALSDEMTMPDGHLRWTTEVLDKIEAMIPQVAVAVDGYDAVNAAHFADARHAQGSVNILRTERGARFPGYASPHTRCIGYHYTVDLLDGAEGDLTHTACQSHFALHPHFKAILRRDPTYYEKVYCETCKQTLPWSQFTLHITQ